MKCTRCGHKAVIELRHENQFLCCKCFIKVYEARIRRTIKNNKMINKKDKVMCVVYGNADSLSMLHFMKKRRQNMIAVSVDEGIKGYGDRTIGYAKKFCEENGMPFHVFSFKDEYGFTIDAKSTCSLCTELRYKLLDKKAKELGCDKVAIARNLDDEAQAILSSLYGNDMKQLESCAPIFHLNGKKSSVPFIKPMRECSEEENRVYASINKIKFYDVKCPNRDSGFRRKDLTKEQLNVLEQKYPGTKYAIMRNLDNLLPALA